MKIVFFGSSKFAAPSLKALLALKHDVVCVVTQPDKQKGRGLQSLGTAIKEIAIASGINVYQPVNVNVAETEKFLKDLNADLFVVIAYGQILSQRILDIPKILPVNVHASFLPKYRGAAPINWAIIRGEKTTGITVIKMTEQMDAGPVLLQREIEIADDDTALTLEDKLSDEAGRLLLNAILSIKENNYNLIPQDTGNISYAPKLKKEDGRINWEKPAQDIYNLVKGCLGWPGAFTYYNGKLLKLFKVRPCLDAHPALASKAGQIICVSKEGIAVTSGEGALIIEELQLQAKRKMKAGEFIAGHKVSCGQFLE